ncbi:MAG: glycosyltransferase involved in cell wall biosynthesis [Candidatus Poriferisodalaceae bacterium]|jgi:glycosyltransferase involved in cell wall biosynthesis/2-polyprenyl-3-methyl-5-hydroxy-6-metoxy-1,4-benzoquinol methylase
MNRSAPDVNHDHEMTSTGDAVDACVSARSFTISVVIPAFNASSTLRQTLGSVAGQTLQPYEVIVVDDESTDNTIEVARSFADILPIRIVEQPQNAGVGIARRAGLAAATGDAISFIDSDDVWLPNHLHELSRIYTGPGCIATAQFLAWTPGVPLNPTPSAEIIRLPPPEEQALTILEGSFLWIAGLFSREDYERTEGYRSYATGEDWDVWIQLLLNGAVAVQCHVPTVLYRQRLGSLTTDLEAMLGREIEILEHHLPNLAGARLRRARSTIRRRKARFDMIAGIRTAAAGDANKGRLLHLKAVARDRSLRRLNPSFNGSVAARAMLGLVQPARGAHSLEVNGDVATPEFDTCRDGSQGSVSVVITSNVGDDVASTVGSVFTLNPLADGSLPFDEIVILAADGAVAGAEFAASRFAGHFGVRVVSALQAGNLPETDFVLRIEAGDVVLPDHLDQLLAAYSGAVVYALPLTWIVDGGNTMSVRPRAGSAVSTATLTGRAMDAVLGGSPVRASGLTFLHRVTTPASSPDAEVTNGTLEAQHLSDTGYSTECVQCESTSHSPVYEDDGYRLVRCSQCELVYVANPPTQEQLAEVYSFKSSYHGGFATSETERASALERAAKNYTYIEKVPVLKGGRLLDVGCSAGFFLKVARDHGWDVEGVEFSPDTAALSHELYDLKVHNGTLDSVTVEGDGVDCLTMWDVIEHVGDPSDTLAHAAKNLKTGGHIVVTTPNIDGIYPRLSYKISARFGKWRHPEPPMHLFQFSVRTMSAMLEKHGFEVVEVFHEAIPISYSIGGIKGLIRRPWRVPEWLLSAPFIFLGPRFKQGDSICVVAKKR